MIGLQDQSWFTGWEDGLSEVLWGSGDYLYCRISRNGAQGEPRERIVVVPSAEHPMPSIFSRLAHEFSLRDYLDSAWAVRPLELVRDRGRTILVLENVKAKPLDQIVGAPLDLERFLRLAIAASSAVAQLHATGLVHKDIKGSNVLVDLAVGTLRLTGFGIASRLPRERQAPQAPELIAGTLSHMAPEQTGRMNRSIDSRSDLYSLGITLYQALTGVLPFAASDPMGWVHCHIAKTPLPPRARRASVPPQLSAIIMKLLAKTPEERYQTAAGLERDLRRCLEAWESRYEIVEFPLGERDRSARLLIPEKLYGREREIDTLLAAFDSVFTSGKPRLVLVSGAPGIGKSSVVGELHKVLVPPRGQFASGKFDQLKRDIPYATFAEALRGLIRRVLTMPESELSRWRDELQKALDPNGSLLFELIPELKFVIGDQPRPPEVPLHAAKLRFQSTLRRLIAVFARAEHPLALFLDDLQWLDAASLDLMEDLLVEADVRHLLLVGAYRDNEVDEAHPLMQKLAQIREKGVSTSEIALASLKEHDLAHLLADAVHRSTHDTMPLARMIHQKTAGNPFFAAQFIQELAEERLVAFDARQAAWRWDLGSIERKGHTDNVVDLMVGRLSRLSPGAREALKAMACLGNVAEISTLAAVQEMAEEQLHADLWDALRLELVVRAESSYRFVHDRVQEAAYSLIAPEQRPPAHLRIGKLLILRLTPKQREDAIFEIVGHFNRASELVTLPSEREELAALNLIAGERAKGAAAYASALSYLKSGVALLAGDGWRRHELLFKLLLNQAECEFLTSEVTLAEERLGMLASRAANVVERAAVVCLQADVYLALQQPHRALEVGVDCLRQAGLDMPLHPTPEQARAAYDHALAKLDGVAIDELAALQLMTDPTSKAIIDVSVRLSTCAWILDHSLVVMIACKAIDLTLARGLHDGSCFELSQLAAVAGWFYANFEACFRIGQLGHDLLEKKGLRRFEAMVCDNFGTLALQWSKHLAKARPVNSRAIEVARITGDRLYEVMTYNNRLSILLFSGEPLSTTQHEADFAVALCKSAGFSDFTGAISTQTALIRNLRGLTRRLGSFDDDQFAEAAMESQFACQPHLLAAEFWYWVRKLQARSLAGDYPAALEASSRARPLWSHSPGMLHLVDYELHSGLSHAAVWASTSSNEAAAHLEATIVHHRRLETWARHCPENFESLASLLAAEIARMQGRDLDAARLYEHATRSAQASGFINHEALALEIGARFYAGRGFDRFAKTYRRDARDGYRQWGADGKVRQLEAEHRHLLDDDSRPTGKSAVLGPVEQLDLSTVLKFSQAVSSETDLKKAIATIMRLALEQAGAERGLLILLQGSAHRIEAEAKTSDDAVLVDLRQAELTATDLPRSVLDFVLRTRESVLLHHASADGAFTDDEYVRCRQTRSVLCMPLLKQGRLVGVIYLENNLTSGAFTPARLALLSLLASDAAISLENARLYRELQEREARVRRLVDSNIIGIFIWNNDGRILDTNDAFLRIIGYARDDLVSGRVRWNDLQVPGWETRVAQAMEQTRSVEVHAPQEWEYVRKDGSRVQVLAGGAAFDGTGGNEGVAFILDLTDFKRAEQALRDSDRRYHDVQMRLADANRIASIGELSASIAHEINQPLSGIITNAGTCLRMLAADPANIAGASETARRTLRDGNRAADLITRLRALFASKKTAFEPVDVNEAAREVLVLFSNDAQRERVALRTDLCDARCIVMGDRVQLQQVILNLLRNALEAVREAQGAPKELRIDTKLEAGERVLLTVRDSGIGLGSLDPERLFDAFYSTKESGMGIGLSVSRSIVESHHGRLWANQNEGRGATFSLSLPCAR